MKDVTKVENMNEYYQSIINAKFNVAKTYSKLHSNDKYTKIDNLKKSHTVYIWLMDYIKGL